MSNTAGSFSRCQNARSRVVEIAASQIGVADPSPYWLAVFGSVPTSATGKVHWCGAFALWCLRQAGLTQRKWTKAKGFIWCDEHGAFSRTPYLSIVKRPEPGDIAYFDQPFQHYAIVEGLGVNLVYLIAGNLPDVGRQTAPILRPAYYSIESLIPEGDDSGAI